MLAKVNARELVWIGVVFALILLLFGMVYSQRDRDPTTQLTSKSKRIELVQTIRMAIAAASEAQNSAVMATDEQDSQRFVAEARAASATMEQGWLELSALLRQDGNESELQLLDHFSRSRTEFEAINQQLLELATQNSNRKAIGLAFGPSLKLQQQIDDELASIVSAQASSATEASLKALQLANDARLGVLRIQVLLMPHILEASEPSMDEFEMQMDHEDSAIGKKLLALGDLLSSIDPVTIAAITAHYAEFGELRSRIIKLSRENTDLRSAALAINEKRQAILACQDALVALQLAIQAEPIVSMIPAGRSD